MKTWDEKTVSCILFIVVIAIFSLPAIAMEEKNGEWQLLQPGVEYATFRIVEKPKHGDGVLHAVRIDPAVAKLDLFTATEHGMMKRTAGRWCKDLGLAVAINAGMYQQDHKTNVGYMRHKDTMNNPRWHPKYNSVLAFGPKKAGIPAALLADLNSTGKKVFVEYDSVIQNLRLLRGLGSNGWSQQPKKWSEAAIGIDKDGRILFLFSRSPLSMWEFNEKLKSLPLGIQRAMHAEGGPEASLSIHTGNVHLDLCGSYETGFNENDRNLRQWEIPNVIGVGKE